MRLAPPLLDDMTILVEVVARGGLTAAARRLGMRKSTVSRRLSALEGRLGVRLVERSPRGLRLTEDGRAYHAEAARIVADARRLEEAVRQTRSTPQGTLRIAALALLGELVAPAVAELLLRHPALRAEVTLTEQHVGLASSAFDLALRIGPLPDSSLVARRLGSVRTGAFASPGYLGRRGTPKSPSDLAAHECIVLAEPESEEVWFFREGKAARAVPVSGRLRVPSLRAGQAAARAGLGIVRLPSMLVADDVRAGLLVQVLADATPPGLPVFALFRGGRPVPVKVRAFLDVIAERRSAVPWEVE